MKELKEKTCKSCKEKFKPLRSLQMVCSSSCGWEYGVKMLEKKEAKEQKEKKKELKEKLKTLSYYENEAKKSFQKFIRLRDKNLNCISCGNNNPKDWCGSHYYPAGIYSGLIFNEMNCHGACNTFCNKYMSGNLIEYRKGLINRFGEDYINELDRLSVEQRNYKYTKQELIDIKKKYDLKIKEYGKIQ